MNKSVDCTTVDNHQPNTTDSYNEILSPHMMDVTVFWNTEYNITGSFMQSKNRIVNQPVYIYGGFAREHNLQHE